jgi:hypothetical protein
MDRLRGRRRRDHVRVLRAHALEVVGLLVETAHRIAAEKRELIRRGELIPEHLEADRGFALALLPQHINHLAVGANHAVTVTRLHHVAEEHADVTFEGRGIRQRAVQDKSGQQTVGSSSAVTQWTALDAHKMTRAR